MDVVKEDVKMAGDEADDPLWQRKRKEKKNLDRVKSTVWMECVGHNIARQRHSTLFCMATFRFMGHIKTSKPFVLFSR